MTLTRRMALLGAASLGVSATQAARAAGEERPTLRAGWNETFTKADAAGVFAVFDPRAGRVLVSDAERAGRAFLPASTFKIANSLIALDTGVVTDAEHPVFAWDGVKREFEAWNRDHTLRSAFKASAVPVYQEIARRIGPERMARYVAALDYGNRDIGGAPIDMFWLNGGLRISALEQIAFLRRLHAQTLPVSQAAQTIVKDIMVMEEDELGRLSGKTGAVGIATAPGAKATLGWLVGWLERGGDTFPFAMNIDVAEPGALAKRLPLVKTLLREAVGG